MDPAALQYETPITSSSDQHELHSRNSSNSYHRELDALPEIPLMCIGSTGKIHSSTLEGSYFFKEEEFVLFCTNRSIRGRSCFMFGKVIELGHNQHVRAPPQLLSQGYTLIVVMPSTLGLSSQFTHIQMNQSLTTNPEFY